MASTRQLSAIMFTDIVGFTKLMGEDEQKTLQLIRTNRKIHQKTIRKYEGIWLKEMGDGTLASFKTISDAVYCSGELISECKTINIELRIGIHFGEVTSENRDIFGDGVNVASRIEPLAEPGQILVSETIHRNVMNKPGITGDFVKEAELKNVQGSIKIYQLDVNASLDPTVRKKRNRFLKKSSVLIAIICAVIIMVIYSLSYYFEINLPDKNKLNEKSIAVLPFESLSADKEDEYLARGIKETVEYNLSSISELIMPTPNATQQYQNTTQTIEEIANELKVRYVLRGTIQKHKDTFRITPRIYDVTLGKIIWQDQYTEQVDDFWTIIDNVAMEVAREMNAKVTPIEEEQLDVRPTTDFNTYDLYMRGRHYFGTYVNQWEEEDLLISESFYRQALDQDSTFALAYIGLGNIAKYKGHGFGLPFYKNENYIAYEDSIKFFAFRAIQMNPALAEAYVLMGDYFLYKNNHDSALHEVNKAIIISNDLPEAYLLRGRVWLEKQEMSEAFKNFHIAEYFEKKGFLLPNILYFKGIIYGSVLEYDKAINSFRLSLQYIPGESAYFSPLIFTCLSSGQFEMAEYLLDSATQTHKGGYEYYYYMLYSWTNRPQQALEVFPETSEIEVEKEIDLLHSGKSKLDHLAAYNLAKIGYEDLAGEIFNAHIEMHIKNENIGALAEIYAEMGAYEKALEYLIKVNESNRPNIPIIELSKHIQSFEPLRNDHRYIALIEKADQRKAEDRQKVREIESTPISILLGY